jgi:choline-sulfatase
MQKPNILFIMTDQMRWNAMGCSGGWVKTPNLDRIASEGVRFSNCVTNTPVCIPARVTLATGLYCHNTGIWNNFHYDMPAETNTWMQAVRDAGYRTSLFGKTHLHNHQGDLRDRLHLMHAYGLDDIDEIGGPRAAARVLSHMTERWEKKGLWTKYQEDYKERFSHKVQPVRPSALPLEEYADVYVGQQAKKYLEAYNRDEPWFCWVSFGGPHEPWDAPEPYASMYDPADMPEPVPMPEDKYSRPKGNLDIQIAQRGHVGPESAVKMRANYAGNISLIDDQIGEILEAIEARGELDNTAIVFSSDHGEHNGDYTLTHKSTFLDGPVRVPLIVRTPESLKSTSAGSVSDSPAEWMDVGPTMVELAGGEIEYQQFAKSLCPTVADPSVEHREYAISEIQNEVMYLDKEWKLAINRDGEAYMLFDRLNDPREQDNLAGSPDNTELRERLRGKILEHLMKTQTRLDRK